MRKASTANAGRTEMARNRSPREAGLHCCDRCLGVRCDVLGDSHLRGGSSFLMFDSIFSDLSHVESSVMYGKNSKKWVIEFEIDQYKHSESVRGNGCQCHP